MNYWEHLLSTKVSSIPDAKARLVDNFFLDMYVNVGGLLPDKLFSCKQGKQLKVLVLLPSGWIMVDNLWGTRGSHVEDKQNAARAM